MSLGERGGSTATFEQGADLVETFKADWSELIRLEIKNCLLFKGEFHADDLVELGIPADSKNCVGAAVMAAVKRGDMEETGARRRTSDPAGHGRKSNVYRSLLGSSPVARPKTETSQRSPDSAMGDRAISDQRTGFGREGVTGSEEGPVAPESSPQLSLLEAA